MLVEMLIVTGAFCFAVGFIAGGTFVIRQARKGWVSPFHLEDN